MHAILIKVGQQMVCADFGFQVHAICFGVALSHVCSFRSLMVFETQRMANGGEVF